MASVPLSKTTIKGVMTTFVERGRVPFSQTRQSIELPYIQAFPRNPIPLRILAPDMSNTMSGRDLQISVLMKMAVFDQVSCFPGASIENYMAEYFPKQTVDNSEAGVILTSNNCPPTPYPTSKLDAPDIPNPYYLLQKSRENKPSGQTQSFLPDLNDAPFVSSADTGINNDKIVADGTAFLGGDTGGFRPVVADQVAAAPVGDYTFSDWGASNLRRQLKQRRRGVERVGGERT